MDILLGTAFGLLAGCVAKLAMPGPDAGGLVVSILVGIAGALVGCFLASLFPGEAATGFDGIRFLMAILGSLIVLFGYRAYAMRNSADAISAEIDRVNRR